MLLALFVVKAAVWLTALGSGTSGGVLAPLLILGGALGALLGHWLPGPVGMWALAGMAAIMSGAMRAPLTGALFAAELTGRYELLPLTLGASVGAYAVSVLVMRRSILTEKISRRGRHVLQEFTVDPLDFVQAHEIMTAAPATLPGDMAVADAVAFFAGGATHRTYPVTDPGGRLLGMVSRTDALRWRTEGGVDGASLADAVSDASLPFAYAHSPIGQVADLMVDTGLGRIPIVSTDTHAVVGILSRHDLLKARGKTTQAERMTARGGA